MARWKRWLLGVAFFVLGVIGVMVPVMPQAVFFVISAMLFAPDFPPARRLVSWIFRRWPRLRRLVPKKYREMTRAEPVPR